MLGVLEGLANWTGLPAIALRIIAVVLLFKVGFAPIGLAYLGAALLMPVDGNEPVLFSGHGKHELPDNATVLTEAVGQDRKAGGGYGKVRQ